MANQVELDYGIVRVLDDSVLDAYKESIKQCKSERARNALKQLDSFVFTDRLTGSSLFMIIQLINSGSLPEGTRLATREDLKNAISKDNYFLKGYYTDFALAIRTAGDSYKQNDLLAKILVKQLKQRNIKLGKGKLIPPDICSLKEDENSDYGLVINLKEDIDKSSIKDLGDYGWDRGRNDGLSRVYLNRYGGWLSYDEHLADSSIDGTIVVVSDKLNPKK